MGTAANVASVYPAGHPDAPSPGVPGGPFKAIFARVANPLFTMTNVAALADVANEADDGIPNG